MRHALTRAVSASLADCQLSHIGRTPIDLRRAQQQHAAYEGALQSLGYQLLRLPAQDHLPDAVFVEDTALVLEEVAVMCRPGAPSRQPEVETVAAALQPHRKLLNIQAPGRLDGGDILPMGRTLWVGESARSNAEGRRQLQELLQPYGYKVEGLPMRGCLHLKTALTPVAPDLVLLNPDWVQPREWRYLEVDPSEPMAANALLLGDTVLFPAAFPKTQRRLEQAGICLLTVEADELAKAEGGVTCCSILF